MLLRRVMGSVGPALVIEVMEQACETPELFVSAEFSGVSTRTGLHGESVLAQAFALGIFAQEFPGVVAGGHGFLSTMLQDEEHESKSVPEGTEFALVIDENQVQDSNISSAVRA